MPDPKPNAYLRTKILTASPGELRMMLLDGGLRFAAQGRDALEGRQWEAAYTAISRCQDIILELVNGLRPDQQPELCARLSGLYMFMYRRLVEGLSGRDAAPVREVIRLLEYERETWSMVLQRLSAEQASATPASDAVEAGGVSVRG
jgi:flagellar protein FliS